MKGVPLLDICIAIIVAVVLLIPGPDYAVRPAYGIDDGARSGLDTHVAKLTAAPKDPEARLELGLALMKLDYFDWAMDVAFRGLEQENSDTKWASQMLASMAYVERAELRLAYDMIKSAKSSCALASSCDPTRKTQIGVLSQTLTQVVNSKLPPKEAYRQAKRPFIKLSGGN